MNKVILIGNVGGDPVLSYTASGTPVVNLSLATSESWKDSNGNPQSKTTWHQLFMFGKRAEVIAEYVKKGHRFAVEGKIVNDSYEKDGVTRYTSKIEIDNFEFINGQNDNNSGNSQAGAVKETSRAASGTATKSRRTAPKVADSEPSGEPDDDLPF